MITHDLENIAQISYDPSTHIVYIKYIPSELTGEHAYKVVQTVIDITNSDYFGILADHRNVIHLSDEAKNILNKTHPRMIATAIVTSYAFKFFANFFLRIYSLQYPYKLVDSVEEGEKWLLEKIKKFEQEHGTLTAEENN